MTDHREEFQELLDRLARALRGAGGFGAAEAEKIEALYREMRPEGGTYNSAAGNADKLLAMVQANCDLILDDHEAGAYYRLRDHKTVVAAILSPLPASLDATPVELRRPCPCCGDDANGLDHPFGWENTPHLIRWYLHEYRYDPPALVVTRSCFHILPREEPEVDIVMAGDDAPTDAPARGDQHEELSILASATAHPKREEVAEIVNSGTAIVLPEGMNIDKAIANLQRRKKYLEEETEIKEVVEAFPWDGAHAMNLAMKERYGWATAEAIPTWFGPQPPQLISVEVGVGKTVNVPWGRFTIPNIEGFVETGMTERNGRAVFQITALVRRKHEDEIKILANMTREIAREQSLYRGKAIKIKFTRPNGQPDPLPMPKFLSVEHATEDRLVFNQRVARAIRTNLYAPIENYERLHHFGLPFKRGVLLAGHYGTGKTEVAYTAANKASGHGITFVYCEAAAEFTKAVQFAQQYEPAVVFCEDIDRVTSGGRTAELDSILNVVDGIENKSHQVMIVLTTNNVERIHEAMIRPGRLDAVFEIERPDARAVEGLMRLYARGMIEEGEDLSRAGEIMAGQIPAVIREVVERSKLAAFAHLPSDATTMVLKGEDIVESAETMAMQIGLLNRQPKREPSDAEAFGIAIGTLVGEAVRHLKEDASPTISDEPIALVKERAGLLANGQ